MEPGGRHPNPHPHPTQRHQGSRERAAAPTPPLREAPLRKPAAERVSGVGGRGRQECRTPTGALRLKLRRWPPPPGPPALHPGSSCSLPPDSRPQFRRSLARSQTPCTARLAPRCSARSPGPDPNPHPSPGAARRPSDPSGAFRQPRGRRLGRVGGDGGARSGLIHMQGTARLIGRQERTKAVPPPGRTVPGSPRPPPRWPPTPPPLCLLRGPGLHRPDGFREEKASL